MADGFIAIIINAVATGIGVSLGTFFANKGLIKNLEKLVKKLNKKDRKQKTEDNLNRK